MVEHGVRGGLPDLRITDVKAICTAPDGIRLVVVKVETNEPGLYGLGCATFTQRPLAVVAAVDDYLRPFLLGRNPADIEDIYQTSYLSSYWRSGPVLNNALSGVDQALWDIKGKRAGMPVYQLLGGKCRDRVPLYAHASGRDFQELADQVRAYMAQGYRYVRCQAAVPGLSTYGAVGSAAGAWEPTPYCQMVPKMFAYLREQVGDEVELLHDVHERIPPIQAVGLAKELEPYKLFFLEDALGARGQRVFPHDPRPVQHADCHGGAVCQSGGVRAPHPRPAHGFHPRSRLDDWRSLHGPQAGGDVRVLWRADRLARAGGRVPGGSRRQSPAGCGGLELRYPGAASLWREHPGGVPRLSRNPRRLYVAQRPAGAGRGR